MADKVDRQTVLVKAITSDIVTTINPKFEEIITSNAKLVVTCNSILARLAVLESLITPEGTVAPKRTVRTAAVKPVTKKPVAKKGDTGETEKVTNSYLFFRYALIKNLQEYRATYGTPGAIEAVEGDIPSKAKANKDSDEYWSALSRPMWRNLAEKQRGDVKGQFEAWKSQNKQDDATEPLNEDTQ